MNRKYRDVTVDLFFDGNSKEEEIVKGNTRSRVAVIEMLDGNWYAIMRAIAYQEDAIRLL